MTEPWQLYVLWGAVIGTGVHAVMGSGGAPEGVITAAAIRCLNGYMLGRLVIDKPELEERIAKMGIKDKNRIYEAEALAPGKQLIFAATGVTDGALMKGVRFFGDGTRIAARALRTGPATVGEWEEKIAISRLSPPSTGMT